MPDLFGAPPAPPRYVLRPKLQSIHQRITALAKAADVSECKAEIAYAKADRANGIERRGLLAEAAAHAEAMRQAEVEARRIAPPGHPLLRFIGDVS